jgi:hypothetical protein
MWVPNFGRRKLLTSMEEAARFVMQARHALPACGQGIAAKSRKVVFFH